VRDSRILKLLIVEDSLEDEQLLSEALLEIGENRLWSNWRSANIVPADRLSSALDCLRRESFDAILLNLSLPDSPALLDSFLDIYACAGSTPILVLADEPDDNLANRLLREGAQDVLLKSELECLPLARAIRYAIERQLRVEAARAAALVDPLTGVLTRDAFLHFARYHGPLESVAIVEVSADREALDPLLIDAAAALGGAFQTAAVIGRWDGCRFCVLAGEAALHRAASELSDGLLEFSIVSLEEALGGEFPLQAKTAMLAD
jgi:DNA-binding NarL/FixJ family response regulator